MPVFFIISGDENPVLHSNTTGVRHDEVGPRSESPWGYLEHTKSSHPTTVTVYVLQGRNKRYVGITNDLPRRLAEHKLANTTVAKIIGPFTLIHTEEFPDYRSAREREKFFKSGQGREYLNELYPTTGSAADR